jgi:hypothetical protein
LPVGRRSGTPGSASPVAPSSFIRAATVPAPRCPRAAV